MTKRYACADGKGYVEVSFNGSGFVKDFVNVELFDVHGDLVDWIQDLEVDQDEPFEDGRDKAAEFFGVKLEDDVTKTED